MRYEARELAPSKWVVWDTIADIQFSEGSYFYEWQAERAARDCQAAFMAGCEHGETMRSIQVAVADERCWTHGNADATTI